MLLLLIIYVGPYATFARRKQLANFAFRNCRLCGLGGRESAYRYGCGYISPLIYNIGTWGLTKTELDRLDVYQRRHLRLHQIIGIHWPRCISNTELYRRCRCRPISEDVKSARWRLFGHVLRMPPDSPAQQAIDYYFADTGVATFRGRPRTTTALSADLRRVGRVLCRHADIDARRLLTCKCKCKPRIMATTES